MTVKIGDNFCWYHLYKENWQTRDASVSCDGRVIFGNYILDCKFAIVILVPWLELKLIPYLLKPLEESRNITVE